MLNGKAPKIVISALQEMTPEWRDHAIACVYALLMPHEKRKRLGAYFTPPHLVSHLLGRLGGLGMDLAQATFHDPAAGGAAFIVPLARWMTGKWRAEGVRRSAALKRLAARLTGTEIDPSLAKLANVLIRAMLVREHGFPAHMVEGLVLVRTGDSLAAKRTPAITNHEIGNPPYRRLSAAEHGAASRHFADIASGRMNLYAMFVRAGLGNIPVGGTLSYIVPVSFLSGPEFRAFRIRVLQIADVEVLDLVEARESVFLDALQDACFIVLRKRDIGDISAAKATSTGVFHSDGSLSCQRNISLPADGSPWPLPGEPVTDGLTLAELGYKPKSGYLVPHRQKKLLHSQAGADRLPLLWAKSITKEGVLDHQRGAAAKGYGWVDVSNQTGVISESCVVVQRTSSRGQRKRLYAAPVSEAFIRQHGGFVAENHIIVLVPNRPDAVSPQYLSDILNSLAVNDSVNRSCGSASIPIAIITSIRLPVVHVNISTKAVADSNLTPANLSI
jgi:adenine-specific DNA-methyltransferase